MCRSSRRSWSVPLLLTILAVPIATNSLFAQPPTGSPPPLGAGVAGPHDTADLYNSLRDVINYGAELFNKQADHAGCYRVYQGALISIRPFLAPETRKTIDASIVRAEALPYPAERAFELRKTLDAIRAKAAPTRTAPPMVAGVATGNVGSQGVVQRVGKVIIVGNTSTKDDVIRKAIGILPGQPLSFSELPLAEKRLAQLGIFEVIPELDLRPTVTALPTADANIRDILVTVKELKSGKAPKIDPPKVAVPNIDLPRITDSPKVNPAKVDVPKVDRPKVDLPNVGLPKIDDKKKPEAPKVDVPNVDLPKIDVPKVDVPKVDLPKIDDKKKPDAPKVDLPKIDLPKIEDKKPEASKVGDPLKIVLPGIDLAKVEAPKVGDPLKNELPGVVPPKTAGPKIEVPSVDPLRIEPPTIPVPLIDAKDKKDSKADLGEVSGKVAVDGKPVPPGFRVTLVSAAGKRFSAKLQKEGGYRFTPGVPVGKYRVAIEPPVDDGGKQTIVPARYTNDATTPLALDVKTGPSTFDVQLMK